MSRLLEGDREVSATACRSAAGPRRGLRQWEGAGPEVLGVGWGVGVVSLEEAVWRLRREACLGSDLCVEGLLGP